MITRILSSVLLLTAGCAALDHDEVGQAAGEVSVTWINLVGVSASGNDLTKTDGTSAWNAGAASAETLAGDGYVEFTVGESGTSKSAGLSNGDRAQTTADIDFALRLTATGQVQVLEAGTLRGTFGTYAAGERFRVEVLGGIVRYSRSGQAPFYTSTVAPSFPLLVDTSLYTPGATLREVDLVPTVLAWQNAVGVAISDDDLSVTKTSGATGWNAGASSVTILRGDGFVEFVAADNTTTKAAGLSSGDDNRSYTDIDYCVRLTSTGMVQLYEGGVLRGSFGKYLAGDRFRVEVSGGAVSYSMNGGAPFYTSAVPPSFPLRIDTAFNTPGATLNDFALVEEANACPAYAGTGLVCSGDYLVNSPAALAQVAICAHITGDLIISKPGVAEVSLPLLERIDGKLEVKKDPTMVRLRLPQLKEIGTIDEWSRIEVSAATRGVDLSRLRSFDSLDTSMRGSLEMSLPCLDTGYAIVARQWNGSYYEVGRVHVPRLREVGIPGFGFISAHMTAPRLERVYGGLLDGNIVAPVLTTVSRYIDSGVTIDAPNLTDIGMHLDYHEADNLPALQRVGGDVLLIGAASVDLPALVAIGGTLSSAYETPTASILDLPALERAGGIWLSWPSLQQVLLPSLTRTGDLRISSAGITAPVNLPSLSLVTGNLDAPLALDVPALTQIDGHLTLGAAVNAPALVSIRRSLRLEAYNGPVSFPALASTGGIICSGGAATSIDLPALTQLVNYVDYASINVQNCDNLTSISAPLLQSIGGYIYIILDDALTALDFSSLTSLGQSLSINRNPVLPNCYATDIYDQLVASGWTGTASIYDNSGTGTCP